MVLMDRPIGIFDSGLGGLTVLNEVSRCLPQEDFIYLADTARQPYGTKSTQELLHFALQNGEFLLQQNIKLLIIACHTICSHALDLLSAQLPIPVVGLIEPSLESIQNVLHLAILATPRTIESQIYQTLITEKTKIKVYPIACPQFVPLIEKGLHDHPETFLAAQELLAPFSNTVDAALLACTHYPLILPTLRKVLGNNIQFIDPALVCAKHVKRALTEHNLLQSTSRSVKHHFYITGDTSQFHTLLGAFFHCKERITFAKITL